MTLAIANKFDLFTFYGFPLKENSLAEAFDWGIKLFDGVGLTPTKMSCALTKKIGVFAKVKEKAIADGFSTANTSYLSLYSEPFKGNDPVLGCSLAFSIRTRKPIFCSICAQSAFLFSPSNCGFHKINQFLNFLQPIYGIGVSGSSFPKLVFFAGGIGYGNSEPTENEEEQLISWREAIWNEMYLCGYLGGIFPFNFLNQNQLQSPIGNTSLQAWIQDQPARGALTSMANGMASWIIPESNIPKIRQTLWKAGLVFDYERDIVAKMDQFHVSQKEVVEHLRTGKPLQKRPTPPPLDMPAVVGDVMKAFGYDSAEQAEVLKVEKPGKTRKLSAKETQDLLSKKNKKPKKQ